MIFCDKLNEMTRLTDADYFHMLNLTYIANSCEDINSFRNRCLPAISRVFNSKLLTFHIVKGSFQHMKIAESTGLDSTGRSLVNTQDYQAGLEDQYLKLYDDRFYRQSPLLKAALSSTNVALKIGADIPINDWEKSDFFKYFIVPQQIYWELFIVLRWHNRVQGMITLWRPKEKSDFSDVDMLKAEILAPHLMLAIHNMYGRSSNDLGKSQGDDSVSYFKNRFQLSKREMDILKFVVSGISYKEISDKLFISRLTVHTHVKNIYRKIGIRNKVELGRFIQAMAISDGR